MLKYQHVLAPALGLVLVLVLWNLPESIAVKFKTAVRGLFAPLVGSVRASEKVLGTVADLGTPRRELLRQNEQLRQENVQLRLRLQQHAAAWQENAMLRQQLGWRRPISWQLKPGRVIGRDPATWWRTVLLDMGSRQGVRSHLPVLTPDGLVGRVATVGENQSQVLLLGDPNLRVAAVVSETFESGVVMATLESTLGDGLLRLGYLGRHTAAKPGCSVMTSGEGTLFPRGILIGRLVDVYGGGYELNSEARVKPAVDMGRLDVVWVLMP